MPPDQTNEQPPLLQEDHQQYPTEAVPRDEAFSLAAGSGPRLGPFRHQHPEEHQSEGTVKRLKLSSDSDMPTRKSDTFSMEEVREALDAEYEKHEITKAELASVKEESKDNRERLTSDVTDLKGSTKHLNRVCSREGQEIKAQREENEAMKLQLAELKDEVDTINNEQQKNKLQLQAKAQLIMAMRKEHEDQQHDFEAIKSQLKEAQRERESSKLQVHDFQNAMAKMQEKFDTTDSDLCATREQLEEAEKEVAAVRLVNDKNGAHNSRLKASSQRAKTMLAKAREDHKKREEVSKKEKSALETKYKALQKELKAKEVDWNEQRKQFVKNLRESRRQDHRYINKVPDGKLEEMYGSLRFEIVQFVQKYAGRRPDALAVDQKLEPVWKELTPDATKFLMSGVLRITITEAYIWEWLRRTVFVPDSEYWGGEMGALFDQVLRMAQSEMKGPEDDPARYADYHLWRSSSNNFLAGLHKPKHSLEFCRIDAEAMVTNLSQLWGSLDVDDATKDAMGILDDARSLDTTLRALKAKFVLNFFEVDPDTQLKCRFGFPFSGVVMQDGFQPSSSAAVGQAAVVDLVVSPGLYKQGNNDGADYQTSRCCIKMEVVCNSSLFLTQTNSIIKTQGIAYGPHEDAAIPHVMQAVKEEDVSDGLDHEPHTSPYMSVAFDPKCMEQDNVFSELDTPVEVKTETATSATDPGQKYGVPMGAGNPQKQDVRSLKYPLLSEAGGVSRKLTQKRKREPYGSDDELGQVPSTSEAAASRNGSNRYALRHRHAE